MEQSQPRKSSWWMVSLSTTAATVFIAFLATTFLAPSSSSLTPTMSLKSRFQQAMAKNLRSPGTNNFFGWFTARIMKSTNVINSQEMIDIMLKEQSKAQQQAETTVWVELGPGNGLSMEYLLQKQPEETRPKNLFIHAFEISERFRNTMQNKFASEISSGLITVHSDDAKYIVPVLQSSSKNPNIAVDAIYGTNVVYFLNPLDVYLKEFYKVLRPGGLVLFGVQHAVKNFVDTPEFVNTEWDVILQEMEKVGFINVQQQASKYPGEEHKTFYLTGIKKEQLDEAA